MIELEVASLGLDKASNTPVVILREVDGDRLLPIWIGPGEASAIAMELAGIKFSRPLTHDLLTTVVRGLGSELVRVLITRVVDNTYYASLVLQRNGETITIDSRPSDSVALALRSSAPIFADVDLLDRTTVEVEGATLEPGLAATRSDSTSPEPDEAAPPEKLRDYLKRLDPEDFGRFVP
ncbi:MAG: bifunctional nuclease family protein [Gemmatimonadetes bacterium]|nr:bifunctional nuclease family protein [Gemmatimonadota bacterium]